MSAEEVSTLCDIRRGPGGLELSVLATQEEGRFPGRLSISVYGSTLADMWSYPDGHNRTDGCRE